jgi:uncharacterized membrane protein
MTVVQLQLWQLITALGAIAVFFVGTVAGLGKLYFGLYEERLSEKLKGISEQLIKEGSELRALERQFLEFKADLPLDYVRREDYIRGQSVIEAKLDAVAARLQLAQITKGVH